MAETLTACVASALHLGLLAAVVLLGHRARTGRLRIAPCVGPIVLALLLLDLAAWELCLTSSLARMPGAPLFECAMAVPAVVWLLLLASARLRAGPLGRPTAFVAALICLAWMGWALGPLALRLGPCGLAEERSSPPEMQSTWWSCGAAAVARASWEIGNPVSEREAALLAGTHPFGGTTDVGLAHALDRLGTPAVARRGTYDELVRSPKPALATVVILGGVLHVVAVLEADDSEVRLYDPMCGDTELSREEFESMWLRRTVAPERACPPPRPPLHFPRG